MFRSFFWGQKGDEGKTAWVAWEKMFLSKKEGRLGVRNFGIFNSVLLAKQAWRVLTMPNSLMARVLRGKYFPTRDFMDVTIIPNASFTWKLSAREVLKKGVCRVIGDGASTRIWQDPWVPRLPKYQVQTSATGNAKEGLRWVKDLIDEGKWNVEVLEALISTWEVQAIKDIPVPLYGRRDSWMWRPNKNGMFIVKSAYYIELCEALISRPSTSGGTRKKMWQQLWSANIPPKAKMFGWKVILNVLPINYNLMKRGIVLTNECHKCGNGPETVEHVLMHCEGARMTWYISPIRIDIGQVYGSKFGEWVEVLS